MLTLPDHLLEHRRRQPGEPRETLAQGRPEHRRRMSRSVRRGWAWNVSARHHRESN